MSILSRMSVALVAIVEVGQIALGRDTGRYRWRLGTSLSEGETRSEEQADYYAG